MERKQEEDFHDLRKYFKRRAQRERDKFDKNELLDNGQNNICNNNIFITLVKQRLKHIFNHYTNQYEN